MYNILFLIFSFISAFYSSLVLFSSSPKSASHSAFSLRFSSSLTFKFHYFLPSISLSFSSLFISLPLSSDPPLRVALSPAHHWWGMDRRRSLAGSLCRRGPPRLLSGLLAHSCGSGCGCGCGSGGGGWCGFPAENSALDLLPTWCCSCGRFRGRRRWGAEDGKRTAIPTFCADENDGGSDYRVRQSPLTAFHRLSHGSSGHRLMPGLFLTTILWDDVAFFKTWSNVPELITVTCFVLLKLRFSAILSLAENTTLFLAMIKRKTKACEAFPWIQDALLLQSEDRRFTTLQVLRFARIFERFFSRIIAHFFNRREWILNDIP